jgi:hypothetical protein
VLEPPDRSRASQAGYRRDQAGYRRDQAGYPRDQRGYPREEADYPGEEGGYRRDQAGYPRDQAGYPRDQARYPRDQARYPRDQAGYPRDQARYPRDQARYPRDQADLGRRRPKADAEKPKRMLGWGCYPVWTGVLMVLAAAVAGAAFTVVSHGDPGLALGIFVAGGTVAAGISVRSRSAYAIIPVPALTYAAAAVSAGFIHDHAVDTSRTALALSAAQWFANGFPSMAVATALAVLIAIARWLLGRLRNRSSPSDLARPYQPTRRAGPGRPAADARPDREDSSNANMTDFRPPGAAPPPARHSHRRPPPAW